MSFTKKDSTSYKLLAMLVSQKNAGLSGTDAAKELGVSRTSVWKAVKKLRGEGYEIEGETNRGYRLTCMPDFLYSFLIENFLEKNAFSVCGGKIEIFKSIDSTNNEAKRRLAACSDLHALHGAVFIAEHQTAGRGRLGGRGFYSPEKSGIYLTLIVCPACITKKNTSSVPKAELYTAVTAAAICRALKTFGINAGIKWVNDIFVNGKKVCGILTEGSISMERQAADAVIIGVGVNVLGQKKDFPKELQGIAGSLESLCGLKIDRNTLAAAMLSNMIRAIYGIDSKEILMEEYKSLSIVLGKKIMVKDFNGNERKADAVDITDNGHLVIKNKAGGLEEVISGEVSITCRESLKLD